MASLGELYYALDTIKCSERNANELKDKIRLKEIEVLKTEIVPSLEEISNILFHSFRKDVTITILHRVSEKVKITIEDYDLEYTLNRAQDKTPALSSTVTQNEKSKEPSATIELTRNLIESARPQNGSFTQSQLAVLGVSWPAPTDWIDVMVGTFITPRQLKDFFRKKSVVSQKDKVRFSSSNKVKYLYEERQEQRRIVAIIRAISRFEVPTSIRIIVRTISRTDWCGAVKETDVVNLINKIPEIHSFGDGRYILNGYNEMHSGQNGSRKQFPMPHKAAMGEKQNISILSNSMISSEQRRFQDFMSSQKSNFNKPFSQNTIRQYTTALTSNEVQNILSMFAGNPNIFEIDNMQIIDEVIRYIKESSDISFTKGPVISALNHFILYNTSTGLSTAKQRDSIVSSCTDKSVIKGIPGEPTLSVLFPNGKRINEFFSSHTFINTIAEIGVEKVYGLNLNIRSKPLVVKWDNAFSKNSYQRLDKDFFVQKLDNQHKIEILNEISKQLGLGLIIEFS